MTDKEKIEKAVNYIKFTECDLNKAEEYRDKLLYILLKKSKEKTCIWKRDRWGYYILQCSGLIKFKVRDAGKYCRECGGKIIFKGEK